jgi:hypothetical protein
MIWESFYWRRSLRKSAAKLRNRCAQRRWPDASLADIEQTVMIGFYAIRKLKEAWKLARGVDNWKVPVTEYPCIKKPLRLFWPHVEELYDLKAGRDRKQPIAFICNQIIHSFVFVPVIDEKTRGFAGVFVSSGERKEEAVWFIAATAIIELFEGVAAKPPRGFSFGPGKQLTIRVL